MLTRVRDAEMDLLCNLTEQAAQEAADWWVRWRKEIPPATLGNILTRFATVGLRPMEEVELKGVRDDGSKDNWMPRLRV